MNLHLSGILFRELSLKTDKNGNDHYHGWLRTKDGTIHTFFFFRPDYDLSIRLAELEVNQKLTLKGYRSKRNSKIFLASDFIRRENKRAKFQFWGEVWFLEKAS